MAENLLQKLTKLNMLNVIITAIVIVWCFSTCKSIVVAEELSTSAKSTVDGLQNIMLMVLGYYLKSNPTTEPKEEKKNDKSKSDENSNG